MNELALSNDLNQIELEINYHKSIAGQSIWEIDRRLNHMKENNLAHGQFMKWLDSIGFSDRTANRMMRISKEISNSTTLSNLGEVALYLIATLPEQEKQSQLDRIERGDAPTVRELQELKRQLNAKDEQINQLSNQPQPQPIVKEVAPTALLMRRIRSVS